MNNEVIADAVGCLVTDISDELIEIFEILDVLIKDANKNNSGRREDYGLRSTQMVGLVVMLWQMGLLKGK